jgi:16S rRNA processing protein RimM
MKQDVLAIGRVKAPNGLKGKMWITPLGDSFNQYKQYIIGESGIPRNLISFEKRKNGFVLQLEGISDISQVEQIQGQDVYISSELLPETSDDEFYWDDLIGMKVLDIKGRELGEIVSIIPTGSNDVFVVDKIKQHMIPWTDSVVKKISIETNMMTVDIESLEEILDLT